MKIIFIDSDCGVCNKVVTYIFKKDKKLQFYFGSLTSKKAKDYKLKHNIKTTESVIYIRDDIAYTLSDAVLYIAKDLGGTFGLLFYFKIIPKRIRDAFYLFISRHRYLVLKEDTKCEVLNEGLKERFIDIPS